MDKTTYRSILLMQRELKGSVDDDRIQDILTQLGLVSMSIEALSKSGIARVVSALRTEGKNELVKDLAKKLVKSWKRVATSKNPSTSIPSNSSIQPTPPNIPDGRLKIYSAFQRCFNIGVDKIPQSAICDLAAGLEAAINLLPGHDAISNNKEYIAKVRTLQFNLKKNTTLRSALILNKISAEVLVKMNSSELATTEQIEAAMKLKKDKEEACRLDWNTENLNKINEVANIDTSDFLFTCNSCKSTRTVSSQKQTRSACGKPATKRSQIAWGGARE